ncbi:UNVERIFIED_CONTAM: hypothetical protein Slati_3518700 [Sesamum latifolium]|uniref:Reverse transcriptase domain-containing protein n=1 Tax=Sesamum latifolium TaxID=2727402 RepID=A0AAW2UJW3_9LAMI
MNWMNSSNDCKSSGDRRLNRNGLEEGDANTKFFHLTAILQSKVNFIHSIRMKEGSMTTEWELIGNEFVDFFQNLFITEFLYNTLDFLEFLQELMPRVISTCDNQDVCRLPSTEEIKDVFEMASFKSPGPDDFPPSFYQNFWHIVEATRSFFTTGQVYPTINHTYITLIPKSPKAATVDQFHPISLYNTTYKMISKILANRIKPHLDKIISPFQMAFVPGRTINENSIISNELMHYLHQKKGKIKAS